jgi:hypothetical protein
MAAQGKNDKSVISLLKYSLHFQEIQKRRKEFKDITTQIRYTGWR